jgi:hypothetical protein
VVIFECSTRCGLDVTLMPDFDALLTEAEEPLIESLRVAMLGTTDGGFIEPDSDIPAGEMFRLAAEWVSDHLAALRSVQVPVTEEWEIQWAPVAADGQEWALRVEVDCDELIAEHADPTHWVNQPHNDDIYPVVGKRAYRRRPAGPWEPLPSPGTTTEEE